MKGLVEKKVAPCSYKTQTEQGTSLRRNGVDLKPEVLIQHCVEQPHLIHQSGDTKSGVAEQTGTEANRRF